MCCIGGQNYRHPNYVGKEKLINISPPVENQPQTIKVFYEFSDSPQTRDTVVDKLHANIRRQWLRHKQCINNQPELEDLIERFEPIYGCAFMLESCAKVETRKRTILRMKKNIL